MSFYQDKTTQEPPISKTGASNVPLWIINEIILPIIPLTPISSLWIPTRNKTFNTVYWLHILCRLFADCKYICICLSIHRLSPGILLTRKTKNCMDNLLVNCACVGRNVQPANSHPGTWCIVTQLPVDLCCVSFYHLCPVPWWPKNWIIKTYPYRSGNHQK